MRENISEGVRGDLTPRAGRLQLISALASVPIVAIAIFVMVGRGVSAQQAGDEQAATVIFVSGAVVAVILLLSIAGFILGLRIHMRTLRRRFVALADAFPEGIAFLVGYPRIKTSAKSSAEWQAVKPSDINAVVVNQDEILILRIRDSVQILARSGKASVVVELGTRNIARAEVSQVVIELQSTDFSVSIGVLPSDVRHFAMPAYANLGHLVAAIRTHMHNQ